MMVCDSAAPIHPTQFDVKCFHKCTQPCMKTQCVYKKKEKRKGGEGEGRKGRGKEKINKKKAPSPSPLPCICPAILTRSYYPKGEAV
mmetsp:Transcript_19772/g.50591  ORF Transcript_19772/g.50591 Transcript_19772/m.50591 type:complete len:87 (+) Transcript_19772:313-573(+)